MADTDSIASPFSLLREVDKADEVLALTYGFNAAFWERTGLASARRLGARVTVVSDAAMAVIDPRAVRKAGITYLDGRASVIGGGAFHPKLFSITSRKEAIVAVGSGNLTLHGWHANAELWTILRGTQDGAPAAFGQIAKFLTELPSATRFSSGVSEALGRTASLLKRFPAVEPSPVVVASTWGPIRDQLPKGPVDSLLIASPFLDRNSEAVSELVEHFQPTAWEVVLDHRANYDGPSIAALAEARSGSLESISSHRYHHGKLVEWVVNGDMHALTGSPNASKSGLLLSTDSGGNVEVGLVARIEDSLRPPTSRDTPLESFRVHDYERDPRTDQFALLLGGRIDETGLTLDLGRPLDSAAILEVAEEDIWRASLSVPAGANPVELPLALQSGTLIRLRLAPQRYSNVVAATLLALPLRPSIPGVGRVETDEVVVFEDPRVAAQFALDLAELKPLLRQSAGGSSTSQPKGPALRTLNFETWDEYLEQITARLGDSMTRYGLALPRLGSVAEWGESQVDPDDPDNPDEEEHPSERPVPDMRRAPASFRTRYKRWARRLVDELPALLPAAQLVGARLLLRSVACRVWDDQEEAYQLLLDTATSLGGTTARFPEEVPRLASMTALCLTVARHEVSLESTGPKELSYSKVVESCRELLNHADSELIDAYTVDLLPALGVSVEPSRVLDIAEKLVDPLDQVLLDAEDLGFRLRRDLCVFRLVEWERHPKDAALRIIARGQKLSPIAVRYSLDLEHLVVAWKRPDLVVEQRNGEALQGEALRLRHLEPSDLRRLGPIETRDLRLASWRSEAERPPEATRLLRELSIV